jgi:hypothetical protein
MAGKKSALSTPDPDMLEKEAKIIELRRVGFTWEIIAKELGYANASGAYKAYQRLSDRFIRPNLEEYRDMELDRLDRLHATYWAKATKGETKAAEMVLKIIDKRAKLLGLDAPQKLDIQAEVITYDGDAIQRETAAIVELVRRHRDTQGALGSGVGEAGAATDE